MFYILKNFLFLLTFSILLSSCSGKYLVKSYPSGAKVYVRDLQTKEKKFIGLSPVKIKEESKLGDVFFVVLQKQNYKPKEVMIRINPGESLSIAAQLDPLTADEMKNNENVANNGKGDDSKPPPSPPQGDKKPKQDRLAELTQELSDLNLRVALLENTTSFYKDAMFSPRFQGGPAKFDRDKGDIVIGYMFEAQNAIASNRLDKALKFVNKAIKADAYMSKAWLLKGSIKYLRKEFGEAKVAWERSLKIDPYNKVAFKYLNDVYKKLGEDTLKGNPSLLRAPATIRELNRRSRKRSKL